MLAQRTSDVEIIVVDNGSTDETAAIVDEYVRSKQQLRVVTCNQRGVNLARNAGIRSATAPLILLCDSDDKAEPGWIDGIVKGLVDHDVVGGAIRYSYAPARAPFCPTTPVLYGYSSPWGGSVGFRRSTWELAAGFDESMSGGGDEAEFFLRIQLLGARLGWAPDSVMYYDTDPARQSSRRRLLESEYYCSAAYWFGRGLGWPRRGGTIRDIWHLMSRAPFAIVMSRFRPGLRRAAVRRSARMVGAVRYSLPRTWSGYRSRHLKT